MNRDCQLIFEVYRKVNPNEYRFPAKPKFKIGEQVTIKKYIKRKFIGDDRAITYDPSNCKQEEFKNLYGKVENIECFSNDNPNTKQLPGYLYTILVQDKRFPSLDGDKVWVSDYELRKTKLTTADNQAWSDLLDI